MGNYTKTKKRQPYYAFVEKHLGERKAEFKIYDAAERLRGMPKRRQYGSEADYRKAMIKFHDAVVAAFKTTHPIEAQEFFLKQLKGRKIIKPYSRVAAFGSGVGLLETFLAKKICPKGKVIGVDFSHGMNLEAKRIAQRERVKNVVFVEGDINHVPIHSKTQNIVYVGRPYDFSEKVYAEARRVLNDENSRLIVNSMNNPEFIASLKRKIMRAGFEFEYEQKGGFWGYPLILLSFKKKIN